MLFTPLAKLNVIQTQEAADGHFIAKSEPISMLCAYAMAWEPATLNY